MESLTKRRLNRGQLEALVTRMFGDTTEIVTATELTEGMFNGAYRLDIEPGSGTVVLKSSPPAQVPLLTF